MGKPPIDVTTLPEGKGVIVEKTFSEPRRKPILVAGNAFTANRLLQAANLRTFDLYAAIYPKSGYPADPAILARKFLGASSGTSVYISGDGAELWETLKFHFPLRNFNFRIYGSHESDERELIRALSQFSTAPQHSFLKETPMSTSNHLLPDIPLASDAADQLKKTRNDRIEAQVSNLNRHFQTAMKGSDDSFTVEPPITEVSILNALKTKGYHWEQVRTGANETGTRIWIIAPPSHYV